MSTAQKKKPTKKKNTSAKKKTNTKKKTIRNEVEKGLPKISENFSEWFNAVIFEADIIDYRYNLKGCGVWKGYGFKLCVIKLSTVKISFFNYFSILCKNVKLRL